MRALRCSAAPSIWATSAPNLSPSAPRPQPVKGEGLEQIQALAGRRSQCFPPPTPGAGFGMEALEAQSLPSSRLANEAVGTTIGYIQASASPPLAHGR